ncbi:uncharacterized protein LOC128741650 [Sabethes cyaneus]|uniref:uncharacterized protein LOC128741650 n=1 Tax=Sabethes cyaneus TaxID=53552 RepID=UPI00237E7C5F|nr:uncharacterized protein LOC128741650 [Sabethes cyaneus]
MALHNVLAFSSIITLGVASLATVLLFLQRDANYTEYEYLQHDYPGSFKPNYNRVVWEGPIEEDRNFCAICRACIKYNKRKTLECQHCFHEKCINQWLVLKQTCPICRMLKVNVSACSVRTPEHVDGSSSLGYMFRTSAQVGLKNEWHS